MNYHRPTRLSALACLLLVAGIGTTACQSSSVKEEPPAASTAASSSAGAAPAASQTAKAGEQAEQCAALQKHVQILCRDRGRARTQNLGIGGKSSPECMTARMDMQKACNAG